MEHDAEDPPRLKLVTTLLVACVGLDQITKVLAVRDLVGRGRLSSPGDLARLQYAENHGAFLGLGSGLSERTRFWLFVVLVGLFLSLIAFHLIRTRGLQRLEVVALALLLGGGIGNLIDRILFGYVRDFLNVGIGSLRTGIFNVADLAVTTGAVLLLLQLVWPRPAQHGDK